MILNHKIVFIIFVVFIYGCVQNNPYINEKAEQEKLTHNIITDNNKFHYPIKKQIYVPIYSDIYNKTKDFRFQLTATLSIRNTSPVDSLFIKNVDYYNTEGKFIRKYIQQPIYLKPLQSIEYVIEEKDTTGGSGANFLITWGANNEITPLFQGVMIGVSGQQGFAFTTESIVISE
ncbi:DUF3124 domain-containing protein [Aquimarina algicola]|uniref:DUF3124 domain-containing protein n=1 Tax=Aquimarina algicola TaxID=2589995 RepID=A0A504J0Y0_9FLAO|nr:DUF3124 domain-containing protein [Aquimarina algicola]TPN84477.1 DUF3124 domain-containing protein [Aquimarina algicola]